MTREESIENSRFFICAAEPRIRSAKVTSEGIEVSTTGGQSFVSPMRLYPTLQKASRADRNRLEIIGRGIGLSWPSLDLDLSLEGMLKERPEFVRKT
jgi:Protein of unknown function (DUF2442)